MTNFIKNNKRFLLLVLSVLLNNSLYALTFRNQPLSDFIKEGEALCATFPENSFMELEIGCDNFDISEGNIENLDGLEEVFQEVIANRSGCSIGSKMVNLLSYSIDANLSRYIGREYINIQIKTAAQFVHCLFESPLISIGGNKINFNNSFLINPEILNIKLNSSGSDYDIIQILFYNQPEKPTIITGEIDLTNNQTTKNLIISNVKEIRIQFISNKNLPQQNSNLEDKIPSSNFEDKQIHSNIEDKSIHSNLENQITNSNFEDEIFNVNFEDEISLNLQPNYTNFQRAYNYVQEIIESSKEYISAAAVISALLFSWYIIHPNTNQ